MTKPSVNDVWSCGRRPITSTRSDSTAPPAVGDAASVDDADPTADDETDVLAVFDATLVDAFESSEHANNDQVSTHAASRRRIEVFTLPRTVLLLDAAIGEDRIGEE